MSEVVARVDNGRIFVSSPYAAKDVAHAIPGGRWAPKTREWHYPATASIAESVFEKYTNSGFAVHVDYDFLALAARAVEQAQARAMKTRGDLPEIPGRVCRCDVLREPGKADEGTSPYKCVRCGESLASFPHQRQAHYFAKEQDGAALAVGMGGGKTKSAVSLLDEWGAQKVLIVCPKNVVDVWPKEFPIHSEREWIVTNGASTKRNGEQKKNTPIVARADNFGIALKIANAPIACVVNFEAYWQGALGEFLLSEQWDAIILDESHRIKAPGGAASKYAARLRDRTKRRLCLTGTLQPHSPLDVYAQARFLDPGVFGTSFVKFRARYAVMGGFENRQIVDYQREEELAQKIAQFAFIIEQDELDASLGLEDPSDLERYCTLDTKGARVYEEVWNELAVDIDEGTVTANNVLTRLLRVQQITSGHLPLDEDDPTVAKTIVEIDESKKRLLRDVFEDLPQSKDGFAPVVVFCRFTHDLDSIRKTAEKSGRTYGELSGRSRDGMTDRATMRDDIDVIGVQMQAGGVGIDLTRAAHAIYYSIGFSLGDYLQSRKRVHRPGQTRHVTYTHLISQGTVDETVYAALSARKEVVDAVMKAAKNA